ncbi:MAG: hypothetical protein J7L42_00625 [Elusimicrobia bacterium]|nr:hypothetical protein [Elusimicrobiota bacterium]
MARSRENISKEVRNRQILFSAIKEFIEKGRPIGSKILNAKYNFGASPATIRNVFAWFEKKGYLTHSFSSSGRIPTHLGIKFYIEKILSSPEIMNGAKVPEFTDADTDTHLIEKASFILSEYSKWVGLSAIVEDVSSLKEFDIKLISPNKLLLFVITQSGKIYSNIVSSHNPIKKTTFNFIRKALKHIKNLDELKRQFKKLYRENEELLRKVSSKFKQLEEMKKICCHSTFNPSVFDKRIKNFSTLFSVLQQRRHLILEILKNLPEHEHDIGFCWNIAPQTDEELALTFSSFRANNILYVFGVLGIKFMDYMKILPLIRGISLNAQKCIRRF